MEARVQAATLDLTVQAAMEERSIPGLALGVLREGLLVVAEGYGCANLEHMVPVTEHTVFKLASITKTFTAASVMLLVERGKMDLDEKVSAFLPGLPASWSPITLRHLLSHTSGIKSYEALLPDSWQPDDPGPADRSVGRGATTSLPTR